MKYIEEIFLIYYTESNGRRYLVDATNDLDQWIKYNNSTRDLDLEQVRLEQMTLGELQLEYEAWLGKEPYDDTSAEQLIEDIMDEMYDHNNRNFQIE